jgi:hypothetical protein
MRANGIVPMVLCVVAFGCGGTTPPPTDPTAEASASESSSASTPEGSKADTRSKSEPAPKTGSETAEPPPSLGRTEAKPIQFPPKASVDDAINAVPQGLPRVNMADDAIQRPLTNIKQYDACKVPRSMRVTIRVAVYDGAAVGVDVSTKPKNQKMESCIDELVRRLSWEKVPSLNTVMFNF